MVLHLEINISKMVFVILIFYMQCAKALIGTDFGKIYNQMVSLIHCFLLQVESKIKTKWTVNCHKHNTVFSQPIVVRTWFIWYKDLDISYMDIILLTNFEKAENNLFNIQNVGKLPNNWISVIPNLGIPKCQLKNYKHHTILMRKRKDLTAP